MPESTVIISVIMLRLILRIVLIIAYVSQEPRKGHLVPSMTLGITRTTNYKTIIVHATL